MNTDEHGLKTKCLSVFICVHPWPNRLFQQPVSLTFALQGQFAGGEGLNPSICIARFRKIAE
jgi:hypothetical protein